jgi:tRNA-binding protein
MNRKPQIEFGVFSQVDMRVGTIVSARNNPKAKKPAIVLEIDFGALGVKVSSAQITQAYAPGDLIGKQVVAVVNFAPRKVADVVSEVLVLGAVGDDQPTIVLTPTNSVPNGSQIA